MALRLSRLGSGAEGGAGFMVAHETDNRLSMVVSRHGHGDSTYIEQVRELCTDVGRRRAGVYSDTGRVSSDA